MPQSKSENTKYYTNKRIRTKIDRLLKENAKLESNLGLDTTKKQYGKIKVEQYRLFKRIKKLDNIFYEIICPDDSKTD